MYPIYNQQCNNSKQRAFLHVLEQIFSELLIILCLPGERFKIFYARILFASFFDYQIKLYFKQLMFWFTEHSKKKGGEGMSGFALTQISLILH